MDANPVQTLLEFAALPAAPVLLILAWRFLPRMLVRLRRMLNLLRLWWRPPVAPSGPPLEQLAADLRRLYVRAHFPAKGVRMPKQRGVLMAYDQRLVETARALGIETHLAECPFEGYDRSAERLRLEMELTDAGLVWDVGPAAGVDPAA